MTNCGVYGTVCDRNEAFEPTASGAIGGAKSRAAFSADLLQLLFTARFGGFFVFPKKMTSLSQQRPAGEPNNAADCIGVDFFALWRATEQGRKRQRSC